MRRGWIAIGILLVSAGLFSGGLVKKLESLRAADAARGGLITVIPKGVENPWWEQVRRGALSAVSGTPYRILWSGPNLESDHVGQIVCVQDAISRGSAAIVIAPNDSRALIRPVEQAVAAGIPCVIIDSPLYGFREEPLVATDNYAAGAEAARLLGEALNGQGRVIVMNFLLDSESTEARVRGFESTLARDFPKISIVAKPYAQGTSREIRQQLTDLLTIHRKVDAVFTVSLDTTLGAYRALLNEGRKRSIRLVGFDSSAVLLAGVRDGIIDALIVQNPFEIGRRGVQLAIDRIEKKETPRRVEVPVFIVRRSNLKEMCERHPEALGL